MFMQKNSWLGKNKTKLIAFIILLIVSILYLLPLIYGVFGSFRTYRDLMYHAESFLPSNWDAFTLDGYKELFLKETYFGESNSCVNVIEFTKEGFEKRTGC